jgi:hypothetical protein
VLTTKKHKGITIINPEAIPLAEERIKKMLAEATLKAESINKDL